MLSLYKSRPYGLKLTHVQGIADTDIYVLHADISTAKKNNVLVHRFKVFANFMRMYFRTKN